LQKRKNSNLKFTNLSNFECVLSNKKPQASDEEVMNEEFILTELKQKLRMTESVLLDTSAKLGPIVIDVFQFIFANVELKN
jgi:hypothetical protein